MFCRSNAILLLWFSFLLGTYTSAQPLQLECTGHIGPVTRICTDKGSRLILTCSLDKTARLWNTDGSSLKVLRVPSQGGADGILYACALSPDGVIAAVGGWTVDSTQDHRFCVYIFSTLSARCIGIIRGLPGAVSELEFTPDGKMVTAGLFAGRGIALLDMSTLSLQKVICDGYRGDVYCCSFDKSGRLVTSCSDGVVRLYDKDFRFEKSVVFEGNPYRAVFCGNGEKIAVGFEVNNSVIILDGFTLKKIAGYTTDSNLRIVIPAWDRNGNLFAAATDSRKNQGVLLTFDGFTFNINPLPFGPVLDFYIGSTDLFLYSGLEQEYGISDDQGKMICREEGPILDFSELKSIYTDYSAMRLYLQMKNMHQVVFSLPDEVLRVLPYSSKETGQIQEFTKDSCGYKFTISSDVEHRITADEWHLYCQAENGKEIWSRTLSSKPLKGYLAGKAEMIAVAFSDGIIRWFDLKTGDERLSLFIHKNLIDWVAWTADGFWSASEGGTKFVCTTALQTRAKGTLLSSLQKSTNDNSGDHLRPQVKIISPFEHDTINDTTLILTLNVQLCGEPLTSIRADVNGVVQTTAFRGILVEPRKEKVYKIPFLLNRGENRISIVAFSGELDSDPAVVNIYCKPVINYEEKLFKPQLNLFAAGISRYSNEKLNLRLASKDACDFAHVIKKQQSGLYGNVGMELLIDSAANRSGILDGLERLSRTNSSRDVAVIYLAGHGMIGKDGRAYFLPWDAKLDKMARSCIPFSELRWNIGRIKGKVLLFLDACYSGKIESSRAVSFTDEYSAVNDLLTSESGVILFCASASDQFSQENPGWNNSAFTKALIEAVCGKADYDGKGVITVSMMELYVSQRVKELTSGNQTPVIIKPESVRDFPFVVVRD
jgi:WD40 repeat protein